MSNTIAAVLIGILLQSSAQFEVASIKPSKGAGFSIIDLPPNGRVNVVNTSLRTVIRASYRLFDYQIIGGPDWLNTERFDIQAKPSADYEPSQNAACFGPDCPTTQVQIMMQNLLVDRFQLKVHREQRELPAYELTIGKNGFKLKEVAPPPPRAPGALPPPPPPPPPPGTAPPTDPAALPTPPPGMVMNFGRGFAASAVTLSGLASTLTQILGRPVIDKTGIKGYYDFKLIYSPAGLPNVPPPPPAGPGAGVEASDPAPSLFTAVQERLGLKLDSTKGAVEVLVIDSAGKPLEN